MIFDFNEQYVLENERVRLSPLSINDFQSFLHFAVNEPTLWKYSLIAANGENNMKAYIEQALQNRANKTDYPFIVYDKKKKAVAGSTRFYDIQLNQKTVQLGYTWYGASFQGTGLNKHCKFVLLQFAFEKMGMERVELRADAENERSIHAMKSIGCTVEGILRSNLIKSDGNRRDSIVLSILRNEWNDHVKQFLLKKLK